MMERVHLFEFEDQQWCPAFMRDTITNFLHFLITYLQVYESVFPKIKDVLNFTKSSEIVDLCSGGGGPMIALRKFLDKEDVQSVNVLLTDYYPNELVFNNIEKLYGNNLKGIRQRVDATNVSSEFKGMRTLFTSFHHFPPKVALQILKNAVDNNQPIGIFEFTERNLFSFIKALIFSPIFWLLFLPFCRPLSFKALLFTYVIPILPFVITWDAVVSVLRSYSLTELKSMTKQLRSHQYTWEIDRLGALSLFSPRITYLLGYPTQPVNLA